MLRREKTVASALSDAQTRADRLMRANGRY